MFIVWCNALRRDKEERRNKKKEEEREQVKKKDKKERGAKANEREIGFLTSFVKYEILRFGVLIDLEIGT